MEEQQLYAIDAPQPWAPAIDDNELIARIKDSDFSRRQKEAGRDYCYFLDKTVYDEDAGYGEYTCFAYTINEPANLESASTKDHVLAVNQTYHLHRYSVLRNGVLVNKIPDLQIKVLDNEGQSNRGVFNSNKTINIRIKDLHLGDVLIIEETKMTTYQERDILQKAYASYFQLLPDNYWTYGKYKFTFINDREKPIAYQKLFFRNADGNVIPPETQYLKKGEHFVWEQENYNNATDAKLEINPFFQFATDTTWEDLSGFIAHMYDKVYSQSNLREFAPDLAEKLDAIADKDEQLQFAIEYVQNNIYYLYDGNEMHGNIPQEPAITYQNKQGDCKAKSVLLKTVLNYIGIEAEAVLVNFRNDGYIKHYLPSLYVFDHVVVKLNYKGETYFVDATVRDQYGLIENRGFIYFINYLEIAPNQPLQQRPAYRFSYFGVFETICFDAKNNTGELTITDVYKGNRANSIRNWFKNTNRKEILSKWNEAMFYCVDYRRGKEDADYNKVFENATIDIIHDDKKLNELTVRYHTTFWSPYAIDKDKRRFLVYWDSASIVKNGVRNYKHKDFLLWHSFDNEKYEINLSTDERIDTEEKYTNQECTINNPYFTYTSRKKIGKNGGSCYIEYKPLVNLEIPMEDLKKLQADYSIVADSNYGLGIDIIEAGLGNLLKFKLKNIMQTGRL